MLCNSRWMPQTFMFVSVTCLAVWVDMWWTGWRPLLTRWWRRRCCLPSRDCRTSWNLNTSNFKLFHFFQYFPVFPPAPNSGHSLAFPQSQMDWNFTPQFLSGTSALIKLQRRSPIFLIKSGFSKCGDFLPGSQHWDGGSGYNSGGCQGSYWAAGTECFFQVKQQRKGRRIWLDFFFFREFSSLIREDESQVNLM